MDTNDCQCEWHKADRKEKRQKEALELALLYAQDIVDNWNSLTIRSLGEMTKRVNDLKQALEAIK